MTVNNAAVFGIYPDTAKTERALEILMHAGLDITALLDDRRRTEAGKLVSVHCQTTREIGRAKNLLRSTGAHNIAWTPG